MTTLLKNPYLTFGLDSDAVAWAALGVSLCALAAAFSTKAIAWVSGRPPRALLSVMVLTAPILSVGYLAYYLRGGPRIVDATYYYLAGRALSHGAFAFAVPEPLASFAGRFTLTAPGGHALGVLFPPGYPAILALAFRLGAPLALGPVLAAALVWVTYRLARNVGADENVGLAAALLSVLSAALRYHTADTMSHGFSALLLAGAVTAALSPRRHAAWLAGALLGWLVATRPVTGVAALLVLALYLRRDARRLGALALSLLPGLLLLALQQKSLTGSFFGSTQLAYYERADGPPGCFRYGFGEGIGCLFEHGDYVRARLPNGYGIGAALATTWRRLLVHTLDIANAAPLALGVPVALWLGRREAKLRLAGALVLVVMLAYAPFYFEGSFPGGGARFFADVLPLEHVLLASALIRLRIARFAWPLSLTGFALHVSVQHRSLRDREGGRPMFEASELARRGIEHALVFVNTDHGFALGHDPSVQSARDGLVVARRRHDALDALVWERLGRPQTICYDYSPGTDHAVPQIAPCTPNPARLAQPMRIEAESLWPPELVRGGWVHPDYPPDGCVSGGRALRVHSTKRETELRLPINPTDRPATVALGWYGVAPPRLEVVPRPGGAETPWVLEPANWSRIQGNCWRAELPSSIPEQLRPLLRIESTEGWLDYIDLVEARGERARSD